MILIFIFANHEYEYGPYSYSLIHFGALATGHSITRFRCDNGKGEYDNKYFKGFLAQSGISYCWKSRACEPCFMLRIGCVSVAIRLLVQVSCAGTLVQLGQASWTET